MTAPNIVFGAVSSVLELGKDESWLQGWLKEQPSRLGLGELSVADADPVQDDDGNPAFLAADEGRYFSVDVQLGEMDASHGFQLLDNWARNRVRHPDKSHVAVLVTETAGDRYRTTLQVLTEHLPLVVVELQVWRGEKEAIVVPHVALASPEVDLSSAPAVAAAEALANVASAGSESVAHEQVDDSAMEPEAEAVTAPDAEPFEVDDAVNPDDEADVEVPTNKDDTGVTDPWGPQLRQDGYAAEGEDASRLVNAVGS